MRNILSVIFILSGLILHSQGFKVRHSIPNASDNSTKALFEISPGNYIGAGFVTDTSSGSAISKIAIMGLGAQGQLLWTKKYKGNKIEYLNNGFIQRCFYKKDNFLYYAGCVVDTAGAQIGVFLKFDMNGDTLWQKIYRDSASIDIIPQMVTASVDGGFLITGFFQNWTTNTRQGLILKTDANGNELWRRKINKLAPNVQDGKAIVQDSTSKKIAIVGYQYLSAADNHDNILILDSLGTKKHQGTLCWGGVGGYAVDLIQTHDKKLVMVGWQYYSESLGGNNCMRSFAVKFDINYPAAPIWKIDGFDKLGLYNGFTCITELKNNDLLIGGFIDTLQGVWNGTNNQPGNSFTRLTIVDKNGLLKWNRYYDYKTNPSASDNAQGIHSINTCEDGSWLATIEGYNYPGVNPFLFVKYDSTGCDSSAAHCSTLNFVGLENQAKTNPEIRLYPNPAKDFLYIEVSETNEQTEIEFKIIDSRGASIVHSTLQSKGRIDIRNLENGMYFITGSKNNKVIYKAKFIKE